MTNDQLPQCPKCSRLPRFLASHWMLPRGRGQHIRFARYITYYHILLHTMTYFHILIHYTCFHILSRTFTYFHILVHTIAYYYILSGTIIYHYIQIQSNTDHYIHTIYIHLHTFTYNLHTFTYMYILLHTSVYSARHILRTLFFSKIWTPHT